MNQSHQQEKCKNHCEDHCEDHHNEYTKDTQFLCNDVIGYVFEFISSKELITMRIFVVCKSFYIVWKSKQIINSVNIFKELVDIDCLKYSHLVNDFLSIMTICVEKLGNLESKSPLPKPKTSVIRFNYIFKNIIKS